MKKSRFPALWAALTGDDELSTRYTLRVMTAAGLNASRTGDMRPVDFARFVIARLASQTQKDIPLVLSEYSAMRCFMLDQHPGLQLDFDLSLLEALEKSFLGILPLNEIEFSYPGKICKLQFGMNPTYSENPNVVAYDKIVSASYTSDLQSRLSFNESVSQFPVITSRSLSFPIIRKLVAIAGSPDLPHLETKTPAVPGRTTGALTNQLVTTEPGHRQPHATGEREKTQPPSESRSGASHSSKRNHTHDRFTGFARHTAPGVP